MTKINQARPSTSSVGLLRMLIPSSPFLPFGRDSPDTSPKFVIGPSSLGTRSRFDLEGHIPRHPTVKPAETGFPDIAATPFLGSTVESSPHTSSPLTTTHSRSSSIQRVIGHTPRRLPTVRPTRSDDGEPEVIELLSSPSRTYEVRHSMRHSMDDDSADRHVRLQHFAFDRPDETPYINHPSNDRLPNSPPPALRPLSTISQFRFEHPHLLSPDAPPLPPLQIPLQGLGLRVITAVTPSAVIGDTRQLASPAESLHRHSQVAELGMIPAPPSTTPKSDISRTNTPPVPPRPPRSVHRKPPPPSPCDDTDQLILSSLHVDSRSSSMYHSSNHSNTSISSARIITAERASSSTVTVSTVSTMVRAGGKARKAGVSTPALLTFQLITPVPGVLPLPDAYQAESSHTGSDRPDRAFTLPPPPSTSSDDDGPPLRPKNTHHQKFPNKSTTDFLASSLYTQSYNQSTTSLSAQKIPLHKRFLRPRSRAHVLKPVIQDTVPDAPTVSSLRSLRRVVPESAVTELHIQTSPPSSITFGRSTSTTKHGRPGTALPKLRKSVDILSNLGRPSTAVSQSPPPSGPVAEKASRVLGLTSPDRETTKLKLTPAWLSPGARNEGDFLTIPGEEYEYVDPVARDERKQEVRVGGYRGRKVSIKPKMAVNEGQAELPQDREGFDPLATVRKTPHTRPGLYDLISSGDDGSSRRVDRHKRHDRSDSRLSITPPNLPSPHDGSSSPTSSPDPLTPTPPPAAHTTIKTLTPIDHSRAHHSLLPQKVFSDTNAQ